MGRKSRLKRERRAFLARVEAQRPPYVAAILPRWSDRDEGSCTKLSAALLEIAQPFMTEDMPLAIRKEILGAAAIAWNASVSGFPAVAELEKACGVEDDPTGEVQATAAALLVLLQAEKELRFPEDRRLIVDWDLVESRDEFRVFVASHPLPP